MVATLCAARPDSTEWCQSNRLNIPRPDFVSGKKVRVEVINTRLLIVLEPRRVRASRRECTSPTPPYNTELLTLIKFATRD